MRPRSSINDIDERRSVLAIGMEINWIIKSVNGKEGNRSKSLFLISCIWGRDRKMPSHRERLTRRTSERILNLRSCSVSGRMFRQHFYAISRFVLLIRGGRKQWSTASQNQNKPNISMAFDREEFSRVTIFLFFLFQFDFV